MGTLTLTEAARRLNVSAKTMRHYIDTGQVEATHNREHMPYFYEITEESVEALAVILAARTKKVQAHTVLDTVEVLVARVEALERHIEMLKDRIAKLEEREVFTPAQARKEAAPRPKEYYEQRAPQKLAGDLIAASDFADLHNIPQTTMNKAIDTSRLPCVRGSWRKERGKGLINKALNAEGRHIFYLIYSTSERFHACAECPH